ncbi:PLP-dependent aminotransferase family protein [Cellulomonas humilata]|uniref:GntR family transcriptional regulator/MocR family aminotransferase n=1 Tax=Cellulomonas humilata TaxID=144055 RepID=A0ABU0EFJ9_9CELL|nr:PLP-dependent aminotransferase family protein [Cellulomonas humilata]MDQ0374045.1 GntR family transcriptional regulator/MocR family aminotransferase [Cellulomonas humilata]
MTVEWSTSPPPLVLRVDRDAPDLLRDQLQDALRDAIRDGRLVRGERLPSSRALAGELGVARGVVTECYAQLQAEGYLRSQRGSATWVGDAGLPTAEAALPSVEVPPLRVDLRPGLPDLSSFPRADWARCLRDAVRDAPDAVLGYPDGAGVPELREVLAGYLRRVRNAHARASEVVVCAGFAQGLHLVLQALVARGLTTLAVEDPGDRDSHAVAAGLGIRVVPVPVDADGIVVEALGEAGAVLVTPAHQSPTGVLLSARRRQELVAWARERDAAILEDDYDAEFRYGDEPVGALQGLAPDRVVLLGSVSKSLAPGLRLGWVVCPPELVRSVADGKALADRGSPVLDQLALAWMVRSGRYDRHLRRMRVRYAQRRAVLVGALREHAPGVRVGGLAAGFHVVATLPPGVSEEEVIAAARERSVGLYPMSGYRTSSVAAGPQLVLGYGNVRTPAVADAILRVADLLG